MSKHVSKNELDVVEDVRPKKKQQTDLPKQYHVVFHNDDYTTFQFVEDVLRRYFGCDDTQCHVIAVAIHLDGKAVVGTYPKDIAETKATMVMHEAMQNGFPLLVEAVPVQ